MKMNKKTITIIGAAVLAVVVAAVVITAVLLNKKDTPENVQEPTTATDIMVVDITDKNGNSYKLEGVGVTDENGKTVVTVTDESGNQVVITGDILIGTDGKKTVTNATITEGGKLVTSEGVNIDTEGATVGDIKDNNNGEISSDIAVSPDIVKEVQDKQEQASMEAASEAEAESREQAQRETEVSTQQPTDAPETKAPEKEPETETPTKAPAGGGSTTTPPTKPTEAPTEAPKLSAEEEFLANCTYMEFDTWVGVTNYTGTQTDLQVPSYINGKPVAEVSIERNKFVKTVTLPDTVKGCWLYTCENLEVVNMGKGMSTVNYQAVNSCASIKEINLAADDVTLEEGWCTTNTVYVPYFQGATLNFATSPDKVKLWVENPGGHYVTASEDVDGFINLVSYDYRTNYAPAQEQSKGMFGSVNFNVK